MQVGADISFKNAGNEKSFKFNSGVLDKLQNALSTSSVEDKDLLIQEAIGLLEERNRKIRIADSSEARLLTVKHYESNPVALNSEDNKKIRAAEKEALRKRGRNKNQRNVDRSQSRGFQYSSYAGRFAGQRNPFRLSNQSSQFRQHDQPRRSCHFCKNSRHWWRECPVHLSRFIPVGNSSNTANNNDLLEFFGQNLHEYEQDNATPIVKGRLRAHIQF